MREREKIWDGGSFWNFMKSLIGRYWKKILIIIGAIFLAIDLFYVITIPATIPQDYLKYGPDAEKDIFTHTDDLVNDVQSELEQSGNIIDSTTDKIVSQTGTTEDIIKPFLILSIGILVLLILSTIIEKAGKSDKKK